MHHTKLMRERMKDMTPNPSLNADARRRAFARASVAG
jgi:hypothetical protein